MVIFGLGSNIGNRFAYLREAVVRLSEILQNVHVSRIFESAALLPPDASPEMDHPFLNMAVSGDTAMPATELLAAVKRMEQEMGRQQRAVWGPREIDIDILAMDDLVLNTPELVIPHRHMLTRDFVLIPFADVAPGWRYPVAGEYQGKTAGELVVLRNYAVGDGLFDTGWSVND